MSEVTNLQVKKWQNKSQRKRDDKEQNLTPKQGYKSKS